MEDNQDAEAEERKAIELQWYKLQTSPWLNKTSEFYKFQ